MKDTKIITIANQKGGCGKTTVTMQLAGAFSNDNLSILVVDADPQGTATRWASSADEKHPFSPHVSGLSAAGARVHKEIKKYMGLYDYILIDCPPAVDSIAPQSALLVSDIVIIPIVPSPADLWAAVGIQELIDRTMTTNETLKARILMNMCQANIVLNKEILKQLNSFGIKILKNSFHLRTAYRQSAVLGTTVHHLNNAEKALNEVEGLKKEVNTILY